VGPHHLGEVVSSHIAELLCTGPRLCEVFDSALSLAILIVFSCRLRKPAELTYFSTKWFATSWFSDSRNHLSQSRFGRVPSIGQSNGNRPMHVRHGARVLCSVNRAMCPGSPHHINNCSRHLTLRKPALLLCWRLRRCRRLCWSRHAFVLIASHGAHVWFRDISRPE